MKRSRIFEVGRAQLGATLSQFRDFVRAACSGNDPARFGLQQQPNDAPSELPGCARDQ
jgi:hypothetical protein